jgi:putative ABC transport system permease protein
LRKIHKKVLRDISRSKGPFAAAVVIVFLGVALFGATYASYKNLQKSYDYSYDRLNFADAVIQVEAAPENVSAIVAGLEGVRGAYGRIQIELPVDLLGKDVRVVGRLISIPRDSHPPINDLKITEGAYPSSPGNLGLVESNFAAYHSLKSGDSVTVRFPGEDVNVSLSGVAISPEYIWAARSMTEVFPNHENFGVFFLPFDILDGRIYPNGTVNQVAVLLDKGLNEEERASTLAAVAGALAPYKVMEVVERDEQTSYALLKIDIEGFQELAFLFPMLFLTVAAIVLYMSLSRTVAAQRPQIGVMRAMGYGSRAVAMHYLEYAILATLVGSVLGVLAGHLLSGVMTQLYVGILGLPFLLMEPAWEVLPAGVAVSLLFGVLGAAIPAIAASRVRPAVAMRGQRPISGGGRLGLRRRGGKSLRKLPLRNVARNKRRSIFTALSLALAVALILTSVGFVDSVDEIISYQFGSVEAYDAKVEFVSPVPESQEQTVGAVEGVTATEAFLEFPVNVSLGGRSYATVAAGMRPDGDLYRIFDKSGNRLRVDGSGVILTEAMAGSLGAGVNEEIGLESLNKATRATVVAVADQPFGPEVLMPLAEAQDLLESPGIITSVLVAVEPESMTSVEDAIEELPYVAGVQVKADVRASFRDFMDLFVLFILIMVSFGVVMAAAIVLNTATLNANERRREHATLRALGLTVGELGRVLATEVVILSAFSLALGALLGTVLAIGFADSFSSEFFTFEIAIYPRSYVVTAAAVFLMALISQLPALRAVARMDLAEEVRARAA